MPYKMWKGTLPNEEPSVAVIEFMAAEFRTSFPATASRYANLADIPCAFATMERGVVRYAARSKPLRQAGAWISPKSPIPADSVAHRLRAGGISHIEIGEGAQDIWFENWEKGLDLWGLCRHYHRFDTTVSLLWFPGEDWPEVEVNRFRRTRGQRRWPSRANGGIAMAWQEQATIRRKIAGGSKCAVRLLAEYSFALSDK